MTLLAGKVALVTGAASGIGRATAHALTREGATVVIADRDATHGPIVVGMLNDTGGQALFVHADVTRDAVAMVDASVAHFGRLDILVNNAGIFYPADLLDIAFDEWMRAVDVMYLGTFRCSQAAARQMVRQGDGGRIVNISSVNAFLGMAQSSHYNSAKGAIDQLTRCMAVELAPHGILVNSVAPGFVETPMAVVNGVNEHETPEFQEFYVRRRRIPLARPAMPEEIAEAVLFLASPRTTYITGHTLVVDGGLTITF
ncbi:MAG: SDR family oxidoreductase [Chloroflexi bacterium]|nr:SDR family oxidoreductase [Chloroflexota bacterium]